MAAGCFLNGIILSLYHVRTVCEDFNSQAVFFFLKIIFFLGKHRVFSPVFTTASDILLD